MLLDIPQARGMGRAEPRCFENPSLGAKGGELQKESPARQLGYPHMSGPDLSSVVGDGAVFIAFSISSN